MSGLTIITLVGLVVLAVLVSVYLKLRRQDALGALMQKRQAGSKLVTRAEYMEGMEKIPVALALTETTFYYENPDLEASFDLNRIDEIEYDDESATGKMVDDNCRVLRLRSHGAAFEFLLDKADAAKWQAVLPPRVVGAPTAHAV
jgi:hypothetical protein